MEPYKNHSGNSKVKAYELEPEGITVQFSNGEVYAYSYSHTGKAHVENMKELARSGSGLGTYIDVVAKYGYARQVR